MKKLLNTLYITSPNRYLSLDGENLVVLSDDVELARVPLHNLEGIVTCGYTGASPALMGSCAKHGIDLCFLQSNGQFMARICGEARGNVILRKEQYRISDSEERSLLIARNMIIGKIFNAKWVLERATRDYPLRIDTEKFKAKTSFLSNAIQSVKTVETLDTLRGLEGEAASVYFSVFNDLILQNKADFIFASRNKRPPLDTVNALLSLTYSMLAKMCASALEAVGLDAYVGFLHRDRPGRISLALDLMEELRSVYADRFVVTLINKRIISKRDFITKENGAVFLSDDGRKIFFTAWQEKKQETIQHPYLNEKLEWGMVPYAQALLLARYIRGDLDAYPPFLWK